MLYYILRLRRIPGQYNQVSAHKGWHMSTSKPAILYRPGHVPRLQVARSTAVAAGTPLGKTLQGVAGAHARPAPSPPCLVQATSAHSRQGTHLQQEARCSVVDSGGLLTAGLHEVLRLLAASCWHASGRREIVNLPTSRTSTGAAAAGSATGWGSSLARLFIPWSGSSGTRKPSLCIQWGLPVGANQRCTEPLDMPVRYRRH